MKDYLLKFRSQVFDGAFSLFKRLLFPYFALNIIVSILFFVVIFLIIMGFGLSASQLGGFSQKMTEMSQTRGPIDMQNSMMKELFSGIGVGILVIFMLVFMVMGSWIYYIYFKLNDNEIRLRNNNIFNAFAKSFSGKIWTLLGYYILVTVISVVIFMLFFAGISFLFDFSKFWGVIIAFVGYFVIYLFLLRFILGVPAIVHGNKSIIEALGFSYRHITWKRSGLIFLFALVFMILFWIVMLVLSLALGAGMGSFMESAAQGNGAGNSKWVMMLFMLLMAFVISAVFTFVFSALSALYFRYSDDDMASEDFKEHLVELQ